MSKRFIKEYWQAIKRFFKEHWDAFKQFVKEHQGVVASVSTAIGVVTPFAAPTGNVGLYLLVAAILIIVPWYVIWASARRNASLRPVDRILPPKRAVFVYGSLLIPDSILRTVKTTPGELEAIPCVLRGYRLEWGVLRERSDVLTARGEKPESSGAFASLVLRPGTPTDTVSGAVIGLSEESYVAVRNRETQYTPIDVTANIKPRRTQAVLPPVPILAFGPRDEPAALPADSKDVIVRKRYYVGVQRALRALGFWRPRLPSPPALADVYFPHELMERIITSPVAQGKLRAFVESGAEGLWIAKEFRDTAFGLRPIVLSRATYDAVREAAEATVSLSAKALRVIAAEPKLGRWAGWSDDDLRLLDHAIKRGTDTPTIARVDMTLVGDQPRIFELNADSPGGMRHLDIIASKQVEAFGASPRLTWVDWTHSNVSDAVVAALKRAAGGRASTHAAILEHDPKKWPTYPEMQFFDECLNRQGWHSRLIDISRFGSTIRVRDGRLDIDDQLVDLVYKRVLWSDMQRSSTAASRALRECVLNDTVTVVNSLGAWLCGAKFIMALVQSPEFEKRVDALGMSLTDAERHVLAACMPRTWIWSRKLRNIDWEFDVSRTDDILADPSRYVLKSFHGFGGKEVLIGCEDAFARENFKERLDEGYVAQEYVAHARELMPLNDQGNLSYKHQYFILGAYVIDGKCTAIEAKCSDYLPINMAQGAFRTAVFPTR